MPKGKRSLLVLAIICMYSFTVCNAINYNLTTTNKKIEKAKKSLSIFDEENALGLNDNIATISKGGVLNIFQIRGNNELYTLTQTNGDNSKWISLKGNVQGGIAAVETGNFISVFGVGSNGTLNAITREGNTWGGWYDLGGDLISKPVVIKSGNHSEYITVFGIFSDHSLKAKTFDPYTSKWGGWYSLNNDSKKFKTYPTTIVDEGRIMVFGVDKNNHVWECSWNGSSWSSQWKALYGTIKSPLTISKTGKYITIYGVSSNTSEVVARTYDGDWADGWYPLGGVKIVSNIATTILNGYITIYGLGQNQQLYARTFDGSWHDGWYSLGGYSTSNPVKSVIGGGYITILTEDITHKIQGVTWNGHFWGGFYPFYDNTVLFRPAVEDGPITNPHMGWMVEEKVHHPKARPLNIAIDPFPLIGHVELLAGWSEIQPEPGEENIDWSAVDESINYWTRFNKKISLRFITEPHPGVGRIPQWLLNKIPESDIHVIEDLNLNELVVNQNNKIYLDALDVIMKSYATRYKNNPNIELVNIRGYGMWGEWHSGFRYETYEGRMNALNSVFSKWTRYWDNKKILLFSNSHEWTPCNLASNLEFISPYLRDNDDKSSTCSRKEAKRNPNYTYDLYLRSTLTDIAAQHPKTAFRRDGFDVNGTVMEEYDGRFLKEFYKNKTKKLPIIAEFHSSHLIGNLDVNYVNESTAKQKIKAYINVALEHHSNFIMSPGYDSQHADLGPIINQKLNVDQNYHLWREDIYENTLKRDGMGYRLEISDITYPYSITINNSSSNFEISSNWQNTARGKLYVDYNLNYALFDANNSIVWSQTDYNFDATNFLYNEEKVTVKSNLQLNKALTPGFYTLKVAVVNTENTPSIKLGIQGKDHLGYYEIGKINVLNSGSVSSKKMNSESQQFISESSINKFQDVEILEETIVNVYNISGQLIKNLKINTKEELKELNSLNKGIYIIKFLNSKQNNTYKIYKVGASIY